MKPTAGITSMPCMELTSTPASSCPTSACSVSISSITGLITVLCVFEHTVVFHRHAGPGLPYRKAEDRALDHQWLAVLRATQWPTGPGRTDSMASDALAFDYREQLRRGR